MTKQLDLNSELGQLLGNIVNLVRDFEATAALPTSPAPGAAPPVQGDHHD